MSRFNVRKSKARTADPLAAAETLITPAEKKKRKNIPPSSARPSLATFTSAHEKSPTGKVSSQRRFARSPRRETRRRVWCECELNGERGWSRGIRGKGIDFDSVACNERLTTACTPLQRLDWKSSSNAFKCTIINNLVINSILTQ
ncbi:hypothetical protein PUN28_000279 [Cardiocondyla obscurior]|uniref:Uncharacterized protein n=1 Tax=Cardiocondyla obscurior TaxID=286306 RepID=A0AAW2GYJ7_9HYME